MDEIICSLCYLPIRGAEMDNRHWHHEEGCPSRLRVGRYDCTCDLEYHEECCPLCRTPQEIIVHLVERIGELAEQAAAA